MNRPNTMRLNNAVEEAIGSGEGHHPHYPSTFASARTAAIECGAPVCQERVSSLKINHAEDEHYGMSHHQG